MQFWKEKSFSIFVSDKPFEKYQLLNVEATPLSYPCTGLAGDVILWYLINGRSQRKSCEDFSLWNFMLYAIEVVAIDSWKIL